MAGYARTVRYLPLREDLSVATARDERPEARDRADPARRGAGHRGARRTDRRHDRRHPGPAGPGPRRGRHRHRRRDQGQRGAGRARDTRLPRRRPPGRPRPAPRPLGDRRHRGLRRGDDPARRHPRRRRRRGGRCCRPPSPPRSWPTPASRSARSSSSPSGSPPGEPIEGLFPLTEARRPDYEAWLAQRHSVPTGRARLTDRPRRPAPPSSSTSSAARTPPARTAPRSRSPTR